MTALQEWTDRMISGALDDALEIFLDTTIDYGRRERVLFMWVAAAEQASDNAAMLREFEMRLLPRVLAMKPEDLLETQRMLRETMTMMLAEEAASGEEWGLT